MFNWLIKLLGGKTKSEYEDMQKELNEKCAKLSSTLDSYANLDFVASGEYSFSVKANSPYSILVKKYLFKLKVLRWFLIVSKY